VKTILLFVVPPLAGALIGFITNVVAIKMLFRPLREIRVFGLRLPFTPGILPRQRRRLADSIGAMVERELLTPELLRKRLEQADVREKLERMFAHPERTDDFYTAAVSSFIGFLRRSDIHRELEAQGRLFLGQAILHLNVFQRLFISAAQYEETLRQRMPFIIDDLVDQADALLRENKRSVAGFLSAGLIGAAGGQIENILASLNVRTLVSERIDSLEMIRVERIILDVMADQLKWINVFGAILGFFIGAFQAALSWLLR
jgi:uncharacterized membrane protein YheB (UPF0754 family)